MRLDESGSICSFEFDLDLVLELRELGIRSNQPIPEYKNFVLNSVNFRSNQLK